MKGRWALDPSLGSLKDDTYDIDNDTYRTERSPDRWNTNPVDDDTDGDMLPDGWEVKYSEEALSLDSLIIQPSVLMEHVV